MKIIFDSSEQAESILEFLAMFADCPVNHFIGDRDICAYPKEHRCKECWKESITYEVRKEAER